MKRCTVVAVLLGLLMTITVCQAENGRISGTVSCARSGIGVSVHPVIIMQGRETLARTLTDRTGKFAMEFAYTAGNPLTIQTGTTPGYLEAKGTVEPNTEVAITVMPRWATLLGIVADRKTGQGLADIPVRAGRGDKFLNDSWATVKTDATGVYMMKVLAFDNDDPTKPVADLWMSFNEGRGATEALAAVRTDPVPLWAWPDPTEPTKVEVSLPEANAEGVKLADIVTVREATASAKPAGPTTPAPQPTLPPTDAQPAGQPFPTGTQPTGQPAPTGAQPTGQPAPIVGAPAAPTTVGPVSPAIPTTTATVLGPNEIVITCPHCGKKIKLIIIPGE